MPRYKTKGVPAYLLYDNENGIEYIKQSLADALDERTTIEQDIRDHIISDTYRADVLIIPLVPYNPAKEELVRLAMRINKSHVLGGQESFDLDKAVAKYKRSI